MDHLPHTLRRFLADEPYRQLSPDELWSRFRDHGEDGALRVLLERVGGRIYARCRAVVGNDPTADEAFQESFAELFQHRAKLPTYGAAVAWLYVTATNKARAHRRWWRRVWRRDQAKAEATPRESPPADVADRELAELAGRALAELPERERRALELVYLEGMTHREAADALGWDRGSVGKYVERGLGRLRKTLIAKGVAAASIQAALALPPTALPGHLEVRVATSLADAVPVANLAGWAKPALGLGLVAGLATVGGLILAPQPEPVSPSAELPAAPVPTEPIPDRTMRVFREEVAQPLSVALRGAVIGGGDVTLKSVDAFDTRIDCTYVLNHRLEGAPGWQSRVRLIHDAATRRTIHRLDLYSDGKERPIHPDRPIILWRDPIFGREVVMPVATVSRVAEAFARLPKDDRAEAESAAYRARLRAAFTPYLGTWYSEGRATEPRVVGWRDNGPTFGFGSAVWSGGYHEMRLESDGRPRGLMLFGGDAVFAPDGKRIDFPAVKDWWTREPLPGGR